MKNTFGKASFMFLYLFLKPKSFWLLFLYIKHKRNKINEIMKTAAECHKIIKY